MGLLEVAQALSHFNVSSAVRFSWWSAEESGIAGSAAYVSSLDATAISRIQLYLNFDMIGSRNYLIGIYDTAAMAAYMNISLSVASLEAESVWKAYFGTEAGLNWQYFNLRDASDHAPFARAGVPFGGLFTGGSEIMSEEQAALFNGTAGVSSDAENHMAGDNCEWTSFSFLLYNYTATHEPDANVFEIKTRILVRRRYFSRRRPLRTLLAFMLATRQVKGSTDEDAAGADTGE